jgi:hypothetical protein
MDYKYIEQLLEHYWQCETSLEEEKILRAFFSQKDIPAELLKYRELFAYQATECKEDVLGDDFDEKILEMIDEPKTVKAREIKMTSRLMPLFKAAAVIAIFLTLGNALQVAFQNDEPTEVNMAEYNSKTINEPSVAKADSAKADSMQKAIQPTDVIIK